MNKTNRTLLIYAGFLLLSICATAQDNVQHQMDSLRKAISTQHGIEKVESFRLLGSYLFDSSTLEEFTAFFKEYEAVILQEQEKDRDPKRKPDYTLRCASMKLNYGYVLFNYGDFNGAEKQARNAMEYSRENELWVQYYKDYDLMLDALMATQKYETLKQETQKLYEDAKERNDLTGMVTAVSSLADVYLQQQRLSEAEQYYKECITLSAKADFSNVCYVLTEARLHLSETLILQEKYEEALLSLQETETTVRRLEELEAQIGHTTWNKRIALYIFYADYYLKIKDYPNAERYCNLAEESVRSIEAEESVDDAKLFALRAQIAEARGQYAEALKLANKASDLVLAMGSAPLDLNSTLTLKARLLIHLGRGEESIALYDSIYTRTTKILNTEFNARLDEIRTQYEVDRHIIEKLRNRNYFLFALAGCLLLAITLGIYIYYNRKIVQRNRGLYRQIKEQDRLAEELEQMRKHYAAVETLHATSLQATAPQTTSLPPQNDSNNSNMQILVSRLREHLLENRNYTKIDINRDELIAALSTNRTTLTEAVRNITGKTLKEYVNSLRLEEARQMLENHPNLTVEAIAEECGFSLRTFHRLFRERYNFNPAEYRKIAVKQG